MTDTCVVGLQVLALLMNCGGAIMLGQEEIYVFQRFFFSLTKKVANIMYKGYY